MARSFPWLFGPLLVWSAAAGAVSKVGGGILSNDVVGFFSAIPTAYERFFIAADQDVRMDARPVINGGTVEARFMLAHLLENEQPHWLGKTDRTEFQLHFQSHGWQWILHSDPCVEQWEKDSGSGITRVLSWGGGRGVLFVSSVANSSDVRLSAKKLQLRSGVCSWK
jgi:hypothetical protein